MRLTEIVIAAAIAAVGCGDNLPGADGDAGPTDDANPSMQRGSCWPNMERIPTGSVTLGTGREAFEAMPDVLPLEWGAQDGYMLIANVRMSGFEPGNPDDVLDPSNPRTRIRAYFADTELETPLNYYAGTCPFRTGYVPVGPAWRRFAMGGAEYELAKAVPVVFETCWRGEHLFGARIRIELEITDDTGAYARAVKVVTAAAPTAYYPPEPPGQPGCPHPPLPAPLAPHPG